ncbi:MAG: hypothetical protein JXA58_01745 [Dehalococcoidia bacterium]|nr:hypothetical protein [Dehalococcoidia bacterium]
MSSNWGPHFIVPSETLRTFSGRILLREYLDEETLRRDLDSMGLMGAVVRISNPWYIRPIGTDTWLKVGESDDQVSNFPVSWDTTRVENGSYEVLGLMHVYVKQGDQQAVVARQNVVQVDVRN